MKKLILFLLFINLANAITINEIMYNPIGNDYDFEYIELKGQGNISGYYFSGIDYEFENTTIDGYLIIANTCEDDGIDNDFSEKYNLSCEHSYKGTLKNDGEEIILYNDKGEEINKIIYENIADEGYSIGLIENEWKVNIASPGKENIEFEEEKVEEEIEKSIVEEIKIVEEETSIKINYVKPEEVEWGDIVKVGFSVNNMQGGKYALYGYIEDASNKVTIHIKDKGEYELMLPIQIKPNCEGKYEDGKYDVIIKGLGDKDKKRIEIDGIKKKMCKETIVEKEIEVIKYEVNEVEKIVRQEKIIVKRDGLIMESNDFRIKSIIPYFMGILFCLALLFSITAFIQ